MKTRLFLVVVGLFVFVAGVFAGDLPVTPVDAAGAAALIAEKKVTVLDVRTAEEFSKGHIQGAKNVDVLDDSFESGLNKLDKTQPYLVHCASGGRSTRSLEVFKKLGFTKVYHLEGGLRAWTSAQQPLVE
jgi:phage shock protein E